MLEASNEVEKLSPKQLAFLRFYLEIGSETFGNAYQSAKKAGYSEAYATQITARELGWLSERKALHAEMLLSAEKKLKQAVSLDVTDEKIGNRALDAGKFIASRLGKETWSERNEITGKEGKDLITAEAVEATLANLRKAKETGT
jgi:hypothetical protein